MSKLPWRQTTQLRTRRALLILDCQNAFLGSGSSNPMLIMPPTNISRAITNLKPLVSAFREAGDELIWINTEFKECRESHERDGIFTDDMKAAKKRQSKGKSMKEFELEARAKKVLMEETEDDESEVDASGAKDAKADDETDDDTITLGSKTDEYLSEAFTKKYPNFLRSEKDKEYPPAIKALMANSDKRFTKSQYSAFQIDNFLGTLRSRMVTEIYFVGAHSNVSIFASIADAAMHGFVMTMIEDCVLFRGRKRHEMAVNEMETELGMNRMRSAEVLKKLGKGVGVSKGKEKTPEDEKGEEVAGTGRIQNPTLDPHVVELLMELKLKDGAGIPINDGYEPKKNKLANESATNSNSVPGKVSANGAKANGKPPSRQASQRDSLKTPEQLVSSAKFSERPKSAPAGALQLAAIEAEEKSNETASTTNATTNSKPISNQPERPSPVQRPFSMDAVQLEDDEDDALMEQLKRKVRPRMSAPPASSAAAAATAQAAGAPPQRVRAKVTMRRSQDKKPRPVSPEKPNTSRPSSAASGKHPSDIARSMSSLSIASTISSGEAEQSQQAKDELLKSIMGKKTEAQQSEQSSPAKPTKDSKEVQNGNATNSPPTTDSIGSKSNAEEESKQTEEDVKKPVETKLAAPAPATATSIEPQSTDSKSTDSKSTDSKSTEAKPACPERVKDQAREHATHTTSPSTTSISTTDAPSKHKSSPQAKEPKQSAKMEDKPTESHDASASPSTKSAVSKEPVTPSEKSGHTRKVSIASKESPTLSKEPVIPPRESSAPTHAFRKQKRHNAAANKILGPEDVLGEPSDTTSLVTNLLPADFSDTAFAQLKAEVQWRVMYHRGGEVPRLVAVQGSIDTDGSFPIYRHPSDESPPLLPFSKTVEEIRKHVEKELKHPVNHVLIQLYRAGTDHISEHSDKTLDIVKGSSIVNVSLGAQRVMTLRTKKKEKEKKVEEEKKDASEKPDEVPSTQAASPSNTLPGERISQKIPLPHNSMFVLGLPTNQRWLHSINPDKRMSAEKSTEELAYNGERISLTFRHIGTFLSKDEKKIWGQGAVSKAKETAGDVIVGDEKKAEDMIYAFAAENQMSDSFDWEKWYGNGFDVLHFKQQRRRIRVLRGEPGALAVRIAMESIGWSDAIVEEIGWNQIKTMEVAGVTGGKGFPVLEDVDRDRTVIVGEEAILLFMATATEEGRGRLLPDVVKRRAEYARCLSGLMEVGRLKSATEVLSAISGSVVLDHPLFQKVHEELVYWDSWYQPKKESVSSDIDEDDSVKTPVNIVDCAVYPYLKRVKEVGFLDIKAADGKSDKYNALSKFMKRMEKDRWVKLASKSDS